jgi:TonB family protein
MTGGWIRRLLAAGVVLSLPYPASAIRPSAVSAAIALHLQESGVGAPLGKFHVAPEKMAAQCVTMVSPTYPHAAGDLERESTVIIQAVISKSGRVSPIKAVSGSHLLETEAMNAVRLWHYKPFVQDDQPVDVVTEIQVIFKPGEPGGMVTHPNK